MDHTDNLYCYSVRHLIKVQKMIKNMRLKLSYDHWYLLNSTRMEWIIGMKNQMH